MTQAKLVFLAVLTTSFVGSFMGSAINLAIPAIGNEYGVSAAHLSWIISAYLLGSVAVLLPMGKLADIVGRKKIYCIGTGLLAVFTLIAGMSSSITMLVICRFIQGMATAMIFSTGMAMLISVYEPQKRGRVIGFSASATYIGLSLGPMIGGMITHYIGWRSIFYFIAVVMAVSLAAMLKVKSEWYGAKGEKFDFMGSLCYIIASPAILYGFSAFTGDSRAKFILVGGFLLLGIFLWHQSRTVSPIFDVKLLRRNTVFAMSNLAAMINYSATFAIGFILSLYLQLIRGFDAPSAGLVLLIQPIIMAVLSPKAGALSDKVEPRIVASIGMALNMVGLGIFAFLRADTPIWLIGLNLVIIGMGFALFSSPNNNAIMGAVEPKFYGVASSILAAMRLIGQAMSMAIVTMLLSSYAQDTLSVDYLVHLLRGFCVAFGVFSVLCGIGVAASLARGRREA